MKVKHLFAALCAFALLLSGCGGPEPLPEQAVDGTPWGEDWTAIGGILGVEPLDNGLTLRETNDAIAASGMYYTLWAVGEPQSFVNADGEDADLYDAQMVVLVTGQAPPEEAKQRVSDWMGLANESYQVTVQGSKTCGGAEYSLLEYRYQSEDNPYERGASAFGTCGNFAVCMEISCLDSFEGSETEYLNTFIEHSHYASRKGA